jgi:hypothetical protein
MSFNQHQHDLNGALLFLETFPHILQDTLPVDNETKRSELNELLEIYGQKLNIIKKALNK